MATIRPIQLADVEQATQLYRDAYLVGKGGNYIAEEFVEQNAAREAIGRQLYMWLVAEEGPQIVGSAALVRTGMGMYEIGRAVVAATHHDKGVAKKMCTELVKIALEQNQADVLYGTMRNRAIYAIALNDGLTTVGFSPTHIMAGQREIHLMGMRLSEKGRAMRRIPAKSEGFYHNEFVHSLEEGLGFIQGIETERTTPYPPTIFAGKALDDQLTLLSYNSIDQTLIVEGGKTTEGVEQPECLLERLEAGECTFVQGGIKERMYSSPHRGVLLFGLDPRNNSLLVEEGDRSFVGGLIKRKALRAGYVEATVLVDKRHAIETLLDSGMSPIAFLPGWYGTGTAQTQETWRLDAVRLGKVSGPFTENDIGEFVGEFRKKLDCLFQ